MTSDAVIVTVGGIIVAAIGAAVKIVTASVSKKSEILEANQQKMMATQVQIKVEFDGHMSDFLKATAELHNRIGREELKAEQKVELKEGLEIGGGQAAAQQ